MLYPILCAYDIFNNLKEFIKYFLNIPGVPMCYNLPASLSILRGIGDPSSCSYVFRWTLVRIPPGRLLNLEGGLFLNRGEPFITLKAILVPHYVCGDTSLGGVLYTLNY